MFRTAIVVGASSGIGEQVTRKLASRGTRVAALARRMDRLQAIERDWGGKVKGFQHDVLDTDSAVPLYDQILERFGGELDLLIYCAGVMPPTDEGEYNFDKDDLMVQVNLTGAIRWMNLAGATMQEAGRGTLVGISSVAGDRGRRGNPVYTASKAGFTAYLEAMRNRLHRYGVNVVTVKPGPVRTEMTEGMELPLLIDADQAAEGVLKLAERGTGSGYVPLVWWPIMTIIKGVPSVIFRKTNI